MYCPKCETDFEADRDMEIVDIFASELEVYFDCVCCGEQYVVTIAQEDLVV